MLFAWLQLFLITHNTLHERDFAAKQNCTFSRAAEIMRGGDIASTLSRAAEIARGGDIAPTLSNRRRLCAAGIKFKFGTHPQEAAE